MNKTKILMSDELLWKKLSDVFCSVFQNDSISITENTTARDITEWDSLNHVHLILAVEAEFGIRFKHSEVASFENVGDMMAAIKRQVGL